MKIIFKNIIYYLNIKYTHKLKGYTMVLKIHGYSLGRILQLENYSLYNNII